MGNLLYPFESGLKALGHRRSDGSSDDFIYVSELRLMWKATRKEDEFSTPAPEQSAPKAAYNPPPAVRPADPVRGDAPRSVDVATIGKSVVVKGELSGSEDLYVDGEVEGSISLRGQSLTIGPNGRVHANIEARNVIVHGRVDGNIKASDRVDLRKSASLSGDISTARVAIEDGAFFKGTIDIQKAEPAPRVEVKPPAVVSAPAPVATPAAQGSLLEPKKF
jgi:cytoskeletal protein CcmA (bactofilin family)